MLHEGNKFSHHSFQPMHMIKHNIKKEGLEDVKKSDHLYDPAAQDEAIQKAIAVLKEDGISVTAYAKLFCYFQHDKPKLVYNEIDNEWKRDRVKITDAKMFGWLGELCELMHTAIQFAWEDSIFSAWMTDKPLKKAEAAMDELESLSSLREILKEASQHMLDQDCSGRIHWDGDESAEQPDE